MKLPKFLRLPSPKQLGKAEHNCLQLRKFTPFAEGYCWEDYHEEMKKKYPIRYFLNDTFSHWFNVHIKMRISDYIYWIKSFLLHKDHLLDLRQQPNGHDFYRWGYLDSSDKMLYGCFNSLKEYVESTNTQVCSNIASWTEEEKNDPTLKIQYENHLEALAIWKYWTEDRARIYKESHSIYDEMNGAGEIKNKTRYEYLKWMWLKSSDDFDKLEDEMLARLIKIRRSLWI